MKSAGRETPSRELRDGQRGGVRAEQRSVGEVRLDLGEHLRLDGRILEHGLDHEVGAGGVGRLGGGE